MSKNPNPWDDICEHGIPRRFCTGKHPADWPPKKYEDDPGIAVIGAAMVLILFILYVIAALFS